MSAINDLRRTTRFAQTFRYKGKQYTTREVRAGCRYDMLHIVVDNHGTWCINKADVITDYEAARV